MCINTYLFTCNAYWEWAGGRPGTTEPPPNREVTAVCVCNRDERRAVLLNATIFAVTAITGLVLDG